MNSALIILRLATVTTVSGLCCPWHTTPDIKCACDDGGLVLPWECCSTGSCNVFCCNCGGDCRSANLGRSKREIDIDFAWLKFVRMDEDQSGAINSLEVARYIGDMSEKGLLKAMDVVSNLDLNGDGVIQPHEFEKDLSDE